MLVLTIQASSLTMKRKLTSGRLLAMLGGALAMALTPIIWATPMPLADTQEMSKETMSTVAFLEHVHYSKKSLSDFDMRELLRAYMANLDYRHLFLLQTDVTSFQDQYSPVLIRDVRNLGDLSPAYEIFKKFESSVQDRVTWVNKYLDTNLDLQASDTYHPDRTEAAWPVTAEDADKLWEKQIRFEIIDELLAAQTREIDAAAKKAADAKDVADGKTPATPAPADGKATATDGKAPAADAPPKTFAEKVADAKDAVRKRYNSTLKSLDETDAIEVQDVFLNTLAGLYDPHSNFFTENTVAGFDMQMSNSFIGIGCVLQNKDGDCVVNELVSGGPADQSKQIKTGDKIIEVAQGDADFAQVDGIKLNKTVSKIRGPEGTEVRLKIIPAGFTSAADAKIVILTRKKIEMTTALAKAQIIDVPMGGQTVPVGVIDLPAFYGRVNPGDKFSTAENVRELIGKLKTAGVQGLVLDVRNNGGGFLSEAIDLTGLFIPPSPVLRVRSPLGSLTAMQNDKPTPYWDGPLMLLVSKQSASATEIMAGALKDYRRALIVGDSTTHGKGTVQQVYSFSRIEPTEKGAAKITLEKWYLPDGNSIQLKGVASDIPLPSDVDFLPIGEADEKNALPWDSIPPLPLTLKGNGPWRDSLVTDALVTDLRTASTSRLASLDELSLLQKRVTWEKSREQQKEFSLNFDTRMKERLNDIKFRDDLKQSLVALSKNNFKSTEVLLDAAKEQKDAAGNSTVKYDPAAQPKPADGVDAADAPVSFDIQLREGLRIMGDWIRTENEAKAGTTVKVAADTAKADPKSGDTGTIGTDSAATPSVPANVGQ